MASNSSNSSPSVGFLTVCEHDEHGLFGGYLVLNKSGRPMEFHCTAPVRANRAQQILYGATLRSYLYGEQIAHTLLEKARTSPLLVFTDVEPVLADRELTELPVAMVQDAAKSAVQPDASALRVDVAHDEPPSPFAARLHHFELGSHSVAVLESHVADQREILQRWEPFTAGGFDMFEPFDRIREAIDEARNSARPLPPQTLPPRDE